MFYSSVFQSKANDPLVPSLEFSLNGFTEFAEFSDKKILKIKKWAMWGWNPGSPV